MNRTAATGWLAALALGAAAAGCGTGSMGKPTVQGIVQADAPVAATVSLRDSSAAPQLRTATAASDGSFSFDVSGLTPPFLLRAEWRGAAGPARLFGASPLPGTADVNQLTDVAFSGASTGRTSEEAFERSEPRERVRTADGVVALLSRLQAVLAPLFERYGIGDPLRDAEAVRALLADVRFRVRNGTVTVTNRATGAVIFSGPLSDLSSGTFTAASMPAGPAAPPPAGDGAALYAASCAACHGPLASSAVRGASANDIREAIEEDEGGMGSLRGLTATQVGAIAAALSGAVEPPAPAACSYVYGPWGDCLNGSQARALLSTSPAGCTGTPVLSQACTVTPPAPATCASFTYSAWSACANGTQTRNVLTRTPAGCTGGAPVTSQACTAPLDGAALYTTYCAGCHGNSMKGSSAASIQAAIDSNRGGMGSPALRALTPEQIAAIAAAP